jgi:GAF domain-containing protein
MDIEQKEQVMEDKKKLFASIRSDIDSLLTSTGSLERKLEGICTLLANEIHYYDWVGFYLVDKNSSEELVLGPFIGAETEHVRISFGEGICGQAAASRETIIIQDVTKVTNYLSCAPDVVSEIVVPIFRHDRIVGELDIDSHELSPFSWDDKELLEYICLRLSEEWEPASDLQP